MRTDDKFPDPRLLTDEELAEESAKVRAQIARMAEGLRPAPGYREPTPEDALRARMLLEMFSDG